jgi:hypothetical protein
MSGSRDLAPLAPGRRRDLEASAERRGQAAPAHRHDRATASRAARRRRGELDVMASAFFWLAGAGAAAMVVGALGPWSTMSRAIASSPTAHGWIVIGATAIGAMSFCTYVWRRWVVAGALAALCGLAAGIISGAALYVLLSGSSLGSAKFLALEPHGAQPAWRLLLDVGGAAAFTTFVCALMVWWRPAAVAPLRSLIPAAAAAPVHAWERPAVPATPGRFLTVGNAVALVFIVAGMAVVVATRIHNRDHAMSAASAAAATRAHTRAVAAKSAAAHTAPSDATPAPRVVAPTVVSVASVKQLLGAYVAAYSAENFTGMSALLAPSLARLHGTSRPENRQQALMLYRDEFRAPLTYTLSAPHFTQGHSQATVYAAYTLASTSGTTRGKIQLHLVPKSAGSASLVIDKMVVRATARLARTATQAVP